MMAWGKLWRLYLLKGVAQSPCYGRWRWVLVSLSGLVLPHAVDETLRLLSLFRIARSLVHIGAMLAVLRWWRCRKEPLPSGRVAVWAVLKLAVHPAGVWLFAQLLSAMGIHVPASGLLTLMLAAGPAPAMCRCWPNGRAPNGPGGSRHFVDHCVFASI